jgi:hypothetical protein
MEIGGEIGSEIGRKERNRVAIERWRGRKER